jgi:hypothetical protein
LLCVLCGCGEGVVQESGERRKCAVVDARSYYIPN